VADHEMSRHDPRSLRQAREDEQNAPVDDCIDLNPPAALATIQRAAQTHGFAMSCDDRTGALLRTLAAARPRCRALELGTGAGVSTAWILDGMDAASTLLTIDSDAAVSAIAAAHLVGDARVTFRVGDGELLLRDLAGQRFELIFADTWPGKFYALDACLDLLAKGGHYVIDDLLPQATWPEGHAPKVGALVETLERRRDLVLVKLSWASGLLLATKR
jgi:predicted O-methyltransferase YrrM